MFLEILVKMRALYSPVFRPVRPFQSCASSPASTHLSYPILSRMRQRCRVATPVPPDHRPRVDRAYRRPPRRRRVVWTPARPTFSWWPPRAKGRPWTAAVPDRMPASRAWWASRRLGTAPRPVVRSPMSLPVARRMPHRRWDKGRCGPRTGLQTGIIVNDS